MAKKKAEIKTHGGKDRGQGRHLKYGEETVMVPGFRCPISKVQEMKLMIAEKLALFVPKGSS